MLLCLFLAWMSMGVILIPNRDPYEQLVTSVYTTVKFTHYLLFTLKELLPYLSAINSHHVYSCLRYIVSIYTRPEVSTFLISLIFVIEDKISRLIRYKDNFSILFYSIYFFIFNIVGILVGYFIFSYFFLFNKVTLVVTMIYNYYISILIRIIRIVVKFCKIVIKIKDVAIYINKCICLSYQNSISFIKEGKIYFNSIKIKDFIYLKLYSGVVAIIFSLLKLFSLNAIKKLMGNY